MPKRTYRVTVEEVEMNGAFIQDIKGEASKVLHFDSSDIYDSAIGAEIRSLGREADGTKPQWDAAVGKGTRRIKPITEPGNYVQMLRDQHGH